jgi:small subunit ribosomal protein S6
MKRTYELMMIVRSDFPVDSEAKRTALVKSLVGDAKVVDVALIGKKPLAYPIKKNTEGTYLLATLEAQSLTVTSIENAVKLGTDVLRYLLIVKGE